MKRKLVFAALWNDRTWTYEDIIVTATVDERRDLATGREALEVLMVGRGKRFIGWGPLLSHKTIKDT